MESIHDLALKKLKQKIESEGSLVRNRIEIKANSPDGSEHRNSPTNECNTWKDGGCSTGQLYLRHFLLLLFIQREWAAWKTWNDYRILTAFGQQLCSAFSADCQPIQLTSEDSCHKRQVKAAVSSSDLKHLSQFSSSSDPPEQLQLLQLELRQLL
ncbi:hypothetical protein FXO38_00855 [Capsicum annuum]|nr:hypothetical protein FXO38_00855 [Capsicum annuum]